MPNEKDYEVHNQYGDVLQLRARNYNEAKLKAYIFWRNKYPEKEISKHKMKIVRYSDGQSKKKDIIIDDKKH